MRKYLSTFELFNKKDEYFICSSLRSLNDSDMINARNKDKFISYLNIKILKFKIIRFQNDRKANVIFFKNLSSDVFETERVLVVKKFEKYKLIHGQMPVLQFWVKNRYKRFNQDFSLVIRNRKNLLKFLISKTKLNGLQIRWVQEYLKLKEKNESIIKIKFKKI